MRLLSFILEYRLDSIAFAAAAFLGVLTCRRAIHHRRPGSRLSPGTAWLVIAIVLIGWAAAEWAGAASRKSLTKTYETLGPTYALELQKLGHARIHAGTSPSDPVYLEIIEAQKAWLRVNPFIADIYTFRRHDDSRVAFIADSETDYNRDGMFDGAREQRTAIGEIYEETTPDFLEIFEGRAALDTTLQADRWGVWVSSLTPVYDDDGQIEAGVGIDFPASNWVAAIGLSRAFALAVVLVFLAVFLSRASLAALFRSEIHQRQNAERDLHRAVDAAENASLAKGEVLAVMGHQIRTPLTAVIGFAGVLSETKLDPVQRRYLDTIASAGHRLLAMLNDVLDLSKIEAGRLTLDRFPWSPALLIHEIVDLLTPPALEKNLHLRCEQQLDEELAVEGDPARVRQILFHLVNNAIKFTDHGEIVVRGRWIPPRENETGGQLVFEVRDSGIGIASDKIPSLFNSTANSQNGPHRPHKKGLGLSLCKRLAELMHGSLVVESLFGHGSQFTVTLRATPLVAPAQSFSSPPFPRSSGVPTPPIRGRALVIDSHPVSRDLLKIMLRREGFPAETASDAHAAFARISENFYAILFVDIELPGLDALELTRKVRSLVPAGRHLPIVAVTTSTAPGMREKCLALGMDEYLAKPVYLPALKSTLDAFTAPPLPTAS